MAQKRKNGVEDTAAASQSAPEVADGPPDNKKVRVTLAPEVQQQFDALKNRMKKLKKKWLKTPENLELKAKYRASQKAVYEFTKKLGTGEESSITEPQGTAPAPAAVGGVAAAEAQFREARKKWKKNRKDDDLFNAMQDAKKALDEAKAQAGDSTTEGAGTAASTPSPADMAAAAAERAARKVRLEEQRRLEREKGLVGVPPVFAAPRTSTPSSRSVARSAPSTSNLATASVSATTGAPILTDSELQANFAAAKRAWKKDRSNDELFQAMSKAKEAIQLAEEARKAANSTPAKPRSRSSSFSVGPSPASTRASVVVSAPAVAAAPVVTVSAGDIEELAAAAAAAKKVWKKDRSNDELFQAMKKAKEEHEAAVEAHKQQLEAAAEAVSGTNESVFASSAPQIQVHVNPLASAKPLEDLRKEMQDARKAWKIDRGDDKLRAEYEKAKEVFEFNEQNPGAKAALAVAAVVNPNVSAGESGASLEELEAAMKEARRVWKIDRDNKELRAAYDAAKTALEHRRANPVASGSANGGLTMGEAASAVLRSTGRVNAPRGSTIQLANLSFQVTEEELREACAGIGEPQGIVFCENAEGKFNGCALVTFESSAVASNAISQLRGTLLSGRKLKAFLASGSGSQPTDRITRQHNNPAVFVKPDKPVDNPTQCARCFIGNLSFKVEEESLGAAFHEMGVGMKNVTFLTDRETGEFYGSAFATFDTPDDAAMAVACTGMKVLGRPVNIKFAEKPVKKQSVGAKALQMRELAPRPSGGTHKAFFGNLDYGIDEKTLTKFCEEGGGKITDIRWLTHKDTQAFKGSAFVDFDSVEGVDNIIKKRGELLLGRPVRIDYA